MNVFAESLVAGFLDSLHGPRGPLGQNLAFAAIPLYRDESDDDDGTSNLFRQPI